MPYKKRLRLQPQPVESGDERKKVDDWLACSMMSRDFINYASTMVLLGG